MQKLFSKIEWQLFLTVMGVVFLSEMGDKTQITTMLLAGAKPTHVFWVGLGSASALICASFLEVLLGSQVIARFLKPSAIKIISAIAFIILGLLLVFGIMGNVRI